MTPRFEDALDVSPLDNGRDWRVLEAFHYDTDVMLMPDRIGLQGCRSPVSTITLDGGRHFGGWRIEVPAGFVTDFASIPRPLWGLVGGPADGKYRKAAVIHDFLYRTPGLASRGQADAVLLEAMKASGCSWFQRSVIYSGVRVGGSSSYKGGL